MVYGVWHSTPFAFVVFYAGLQTVPSDTIEAAKIDGASRWQQVRFVIVPYMAPLLVFRWISLLPPAESVTVSLPLDCAIAEVANRRDSATAPKKLLLILVALLRAAPCRLDPVRSTVRRASFI